MGLIKVTQIERNGVTIASEDMLIDTEDLNRPIVENSSNKAVVYLQESIMEGRQSEANNSVQYILDETLAAVHALSTNLFPATVLTRNGNAPVVGAVLLGFTTHRIVGSIREDTTSGGSRFFYHEDGDNLPVEYVVSETVAAIEASL